MGMPRDKDARKYYRAGLQRLEDAMFLLESGRTTAAIYLAGYSVECLMKALILSFAATTDRDSVLKLFRGSKAHEYDWLRKEYYKLKAPRFPREVIQAFSDVAVWSTDLRYEPGTRTDELATAFLDAVKIIREWADRSL